MTAAFDFSTWRDRNLLEQYVALRMEAADESMADSERRLSASDAKSARREIVRRMKGRK